MSAEQVGLRSYRGDVISAVREAGEQRALWDHDWSESALEELERLAGSSQDFTADDLVAEVGAPDSPGAVGAAFSKAAKSGLIRTVGYATSRRVGRHGGLVRVWRGRADD